MKQLRKEQKRKVHSSFMENNLGADLTDMQLIIQFYKGFRFYYVFLIFIANIHGLFLDQIKK